MASLAVVIPFPFHRVRRRVRRVADVFAPLREAAQLERAQSRLVLGCTAVATAMSVALQLTLG